MAVISPLDAIADALAFHFGDEIANLKTLRGWPEKGEDLDLDGLENGESYEAVLSVTASPQFDLARVAPVDVGQTLDQQTGLVEVLYRVAWLTGRIQLDLWAPHRSTRDDFAALINEKSANRLPYTSDLRLLSTGFFGRSGYYGRPSKIDLVSAATPDSGDNVTIGEYRRTWTAEVSSDIVIPKSHPVLGSLGINLTTQLGPLSVTDTLTITP